MKSPALIGLLCLALTQVTRAEESPGQPAKNRPADAAPEPTIREQLAATLPKYTPPPPEAKPEDKPADPDVLELPKMVVKQRPRPRLTPDVVVTRQGLGEQLANQKFSELDRILNKFTLPLFGSSMAERALDDYEREKKQQLNLDVLNLSKALETSDPSEAKALREAAAKP
jgi:hypothetical protein